MRTLIQISSTLLALLATFKTEAEAISWPGLLGPERNGQVHHFQVPSLWPDKLEQRWKVEVGDGYGTPLVRAGRVYQHARMNGEEVLWCLDFDSGNTLWKNGHPVPFKMGNGGEGHGKGPKSCPVLAGDRVFTFSITGVLSAWHADHGKLLWRHDESERFETTHPYWGASMSPIVDGDKVIVRFGNDETGLLVALDVATGKKIWSLGDDGACYASPIVVDLEGVRQLVEWNHEALIGVDISSGETLWRFPLPHLGSNQNMPTPSFYQGSILVGGENRGVRRIQPVRNGSAWSVTETWHQKRVALDMSTAVVHGDHLFGFSHFGLGQIFCLDPRQGDILWQGPSRTGENVAFLALKDHLAALINDGTFWILAASAQGFQKVASYRVAESPTWAPPVLWGQSLLVKDRQMLTRWSFAKELR